MQKDPSPHIASNLGQTDELGALAKLISDAVLVVKSEYSNAQRSPPSICSTELDAFCSPDVASKQLQAAIKTIEAACAQLSATVASPDHVLTDKVFGYIEPACLRVAIEAKIADHLLEKPGGLHVDELGKLSEQDPVKLGRILRTLATNHTFLEVAPNVFANNRLSMKLLSTDPMSSLVVMFSDHTMKACAFLGDVFADPTKRGSNRCEDTAFHLAHGATFFQFMANPDNTKYYDRFSQSMIAWASVTGKNTIPKAYPWDKLPLGSRIIDVGGGKGHTILPLLQACPNLSLVLQDTPAVLAEGKQYWEKEFPEAVELQKVSFISVDFLNEPPVKGGAVYFVWHDWPDEECILILKNIRRAASPGSKLLIHEVIPRNNVFGAFAAETKAPEPLLPNWGASDKWLYQLDINMMQQFNSKERALEEFIVLGKKCGFEFVKLWGGGEAGLVEFTPV